MKIITYKPGKRILSNKNNYVQINWSNKLWYKGYWKNKRIGYCESYMELRNKGITYII
jgi:hypothetical protein